MQLWYALDKHLAQVSEKAVLSLHKVLQKLCVLDMASRNLALGNKKKLTKTI